MKWSDDGNYGQIGVELGVGIVLIPEAQPMSSIHLGWRGRGGALTLAKTQRSRGKEISSMLCFLCESLKRAPAAR